MHKESECIVCSNDNTIEKKQCPYCFVPTELHSEYITFMAPMLMLGRDDFKGLQCCMDCFSKPMLDALEVTVERMGEFGVEAVKKDLLASCNGEMEAEDCKKGHPRINNVRDFLFAAEHICRNRQAKEQIAAEAAAKKKKKRISLSRIQNVWQILVVFLIPLFLPFIVLFTSITQFPQQFVLGAVFMVTCCLAQITVIAALLFNKQDWIIWLESPLIQERTGMPGVVISLSYFYSACCHIVALIPYSILYSLLWIPDSPPKYLQWLITLM